VADQRLPERRPGGIVDPRAVRGRGPLRTGRGSGGLRAHLGRPAAAPGMAAAGRRPRGRPDPICTTSTAGRRPSSTCSGRASSRGSGRHDGSDCDLHARTRQRESRSVTFPLCGRRSRAYRACPAFVRPLVGSTPVCGAEGAFCPLHASGEQLWEGLWPVFGASSPSLAALAAFWGCQSPADHWPGRPARSAPHPRFITFHRISWWESFVLHYALEIVRSYLHVGSSTAKTQ
jgi:hypothetical protein